MSALRDSLPHHDPETKAVTGELLRDSSGTSLCQTKAVTRITCAACYRAIGMQELVYRPLFGGWEGTYCAECFPAVQAKSTWRSWRSFAPACACTFCGRLVVLPMDARCTDRERRSALEHCSTACEARARRARRRKAVFCEACGVEFIQARKDQRHCSAKCKQRAYRARKSA